jgi:hypothetical protein
VVLSALFGGWAEAHTRSETHSNWVIAGRRVTLVFTLPDLERRRLTNAGLATPASVAAYLSRRVLARTAGVPCRRLAGPLPLAAAQGYSRFESVFDCQGAGAISLTSTAFLDLVPSHTNFAQIRTADGRFIEQLFTADRTVLDLSAVNAKSPLMDASFLDYVRLGVMHIFTGVDHQLFLLGLILLSRRLRDLLFVITGFTIGHSITLALAVTGVLRPHAEFIDALIGFTIALVGAERLAETSGRPGWVALAVLSLLIAMAVIEPFGLVSMPAALLLGSGVFGANYMLIAGRLQDVGRLRIAVTLIFGLIHGFGFAADLLEMKLPSARLAELLVGFNLGVETGQLLLVSAVVGIGALLARTPARLGSAVFGETASASLIGVGLFWFVSRGFAAGGAHLG